MVERLLVDGLPADGVPADDRGLAYGDGVFETLRVARGRIPLWALHWARLVRGCERLGIALSPRDTIERELADLLQGVTEAVAKLVVTRGGAARGYSSASATRPRRILMRFPPPAAATGPVAAIVVRDLRLPRDERLGGIKHLNRLHQVLARAEVDARGADEGLCLDDADTVVCACSANVFARIDGAWFAPDPAAAGVEGVCRAALLADATFGPQVSVAALDLAALGRADAIFLSNAVRGVVPVAALDGRALDPSAPAPALAALAALGFPQPAA
jgi:4-amino-4-deoxychorismate lyase